jgi:phosphoglucomutase
MEEMMATHPLAGKPAPRELLVNVPRLVSAYYTGKPDASVPEQQVAFGTSGHRGSSLLTSFNEDHILAICQALCEWRRAQGIDGPLYIGMDTHALSEPALATAIEVLAANEMDIFIQAGLGYTPTPVISHAILTYNRGRTSGLADGVVITPSHNPPEDGGFKYNPPSGGPADTQTTKQIQDRANQLLAGGLKEVRRLPLARALKAETTHMYDYVTPYVADLGSVIDMQAIAGAGIAIGVDPMGGAALGFWAPIAEAYKLNLQVVNPVIDPTFAFMTVDKDGKIRMDCSSPYAMAGLIGLKDRFDIAFGNDPAAYSMSKFEVPYACMSKRSVAYLTGIGVVFAGTNGLMAVSGPGQVRNLTDDIDAVLEAADLEAPGPVAMANLMDRLVDVAVGLGEGVLALAERHAGAVSEFLDVHSGNLAHAA